MEVKLIVVGGKRPGMTVPVPGPEFTIGRAEGCQLRPNSDQISRRHCMLAVKEGSVTIRDLGSRNGTFVNGEEIPPKTDKELKSGDHVKVGPLEFEIHLTVSVGGKKKPKVKNVQEAAARTVQSSNSEDIDVASWLNEDDDEAADEEEDVRSTKIVPPAPAAKTEAHPSQEPTTEVTYDPLLGPPPPKPTAASSRDAAADMLKQFLKRRP
jgi:predicted component of type VI protein secretion system